MTDSWIRDTTPYRWPYDGRLDADRLALIVCGADDDWAERCATDPEADAALFELVAAARSCGVQVISLLHRPPAGSVAWPRPSGQSSPAMPELDTDLEIEAAGIDGFYGSSLDAELQRRGRTHLLLAGRGFETTVHSTLRRANDRGYECLTVADACTTVDPRNRTASISTIEMSGGIFGAVGNANAVIDTLRTLSGSDQPGTETKGI